MIPAAPGVVIETISHQRLNCPGRKTYQALVWVETGFLQCTIFLIENSENICDPQSIWQKKTVHFHAKVNCKSLRKNSLKLTAGPFGVGFD